MAFAPLDLMDPEAQERRKKMEEDIKKAKEEETMAELKALGLNFKKDKTLSFSEAELMDLILAIIIISATTVAILAFLFTTDNILGLGSAFFLSIFDSVAVANIVYKLCHKGL